MKPTTQKLPTDHYTEYNGQKVHWFIGDFDADNDHWQAWGSCNGHAYQLFAKYHEGTRTLFDIIVLYDPNNPYHHQETYELLTK